MTRERSIAVALGVAIAAIAGTIVIASALARPAGESATGIVIEVDSASLTDVRGFTIRTPDGSTIEFRMGELENGASFPPGHLLEHRATSQPVKVFYRDEGGALVAYRIDDAPR